ncbi:MAG TPA: peptidylprolyl isomerase [Acidimicrobiales bacterium]
MANRTSQQDRDRRAAREQAARKAAERSDRRRKIIAIVAVVIVLLAVAGTLFAAANGADQAKPKASSTTVTTLPGDSSSTLASGPPASLPTPQGGAALSGPTPCPAEDGSSPRTTLFTGPPPQCIDNAKQWNAVITTSAGPLTLSLYTDLAPKAVNNFAVLARYHYWDGLALSSIIPRNTMQVGTDLTTEGKTSPGYTLPAEYQKGGIVITPGMLAMAPVSATEIGGGLLMALGEKAADLPPSTTIIGLLLDGADTLAAINKAGSADGAPTKVITITSVKVIPAPVSTSTTA